MTGGVRRSLSVVILEPLSLAILSVVAISRQLLSAAGYRNGCIVSCLISGPA